MSTAKFLRSLHMDRKAGPKFRGQSPLQRHMGVRFDAHMAEHARAGTAAPNFRRKPPLRATLKLSRRPVDNTTSDRKCSPKFAEVWPQIREVRPQSSGIPAPNSWSNL